MELVAISVSAAERATSGRGGVVGTPDRGHGVGGSDRFSIETAPDGTVTAHCEPGPPGNF